MNNNGTPAQETKRFSPDIVFHKPKSEGGGCASKWQLSDKKHESKYEPYRPFLVLAAQSGKDEHGNSRFDWQNAVKVKLGESDIGEMLAVLDGIQTAAGATKKGTGLFHQSPSGGNKSINFEQSKGGEGYYLRVSAQSQNREVVTLSHKLTHGEGRLLKLFLEHSFLKMRAFLAGE